MSHDGHDTHMIFVYNITIKENIRFSYELSMVAEQSVWSGSRQITKVGASLLFGASLLLTQDWNQEIQFQEILWSEYQLQR